jgi:hypothetical protein
MKTRLTRLQDEHRRRPEDVPPHDILGCHNHPVQLSVIGPLARLDAFGAGALLEEVGRVRFREEELEQEGDAEAEDEEEPGDAGTR